MICVKCNEAYDGASRRCHMCGAIYPPDLPPAPPVIEHAVKEVRLIAVIKKRKPKADK